MNNAKLYLMISPRLVKEDLGLYMMREEIKSIYYPACLLLFLLSYPELKM